MAIIDAPQKSESADSQDKPITRGVITPDSEYSEHPMSDLELQIAILRATSFML